MAQSDEDIRADVYDIVREVLELDEEEWPDTELEKKTLRALGADEAARTAIAEEIEEKLDAEVPDTDIHKRGLTVKKLAALVIALIDEE